MSLSGTIKSLQDTMRKDAGIDGDAQRIGQLAWILFFKIYSDLELEAELDDETYVSPVPVHLRWHAWADEDVLGKAAPTGDALLELVDGKAGLFATLSSLELDRLQGTARNRAELLQAVFSDAYNYMKSGTLLRQVINKINANIDFNEASTRHLFGDIYEGILKDLQSAGNAGEFYTPRAVTQFAVEMVDPQLGESVLDPACGTGGFLTGAYEHLKSQALTSAELVLAKSSIHGVEKKALPHLLCTTNMLVHGVEDPSNIRHGNTLERPLRDYGPTDRVDVVLINPPYGGIEEEHIKRNFPVEFRTSETAALFLTLVMELLRPGGRAAVVLSDGFLFGEDAVQTRIKKRLLKEFNLHTVLRLPEKVFAPYTGIKTNILFFSKGGPTESVWYYEHPYPEGQKSYSKTRPITLDEFQPERDWWKDRKETSQAWSVPVEDLIASGYNFDLSNPRAESIEHEDPAILLARYAESASSVANARAELLQALGVSLSAPLGSASQSSSKRRED